jgi:hypothetical protein
MMSLEMTKVKNPGHKWSTIARKCQREGVSALTDEEKNILADLFVKETKKGSYKIQGRADDTILNGFLSHVQQSFSKHSKVVIDHRTTLLKHAKQLSTEKPAIISLILYITWVEHWANSISTSLYLKNGISKGDLKKFIRFKSPHEKLIELQSKFRLRPVKKAHGARIEELNIKRNRYVHFKWKGLSEKELKEEHKEINTLVRQMPKTIEYLLWYEERRLFPKEVAIAKRLFQTSEVKP